MRRLELDPPADRDPVVAVERVDKAWRQLRHAILATGDRAAITAAVNYSGAMADFERVRPGLLDRAAAWQRIPRSDHQRIRDRAQAGVSVSELAQEYQVTTARIRQICAGGGE